MSSLLDRPATGAVERRAAAPRISLPAVALAVVAVLGTWLGSGLGPSPIVRYVAFEALYVVLPGCLLYVLLSPAPGGRLRTLAIGWPLGYAVEVGGFALTASVGARGALAALPLLSLILAAALLARPAGRARLRALLTPADGRGGERGLGFRPWPAWALAVTAAALVLGLTFFASSPLPERARSVVYVGDNVFDVSLASEARHHWPITMPWVAGEPLRYYTGVFMDTAAVNQVMGVSLASVILRLLPSTLLLIAALQLWALGGTVGRSRWIGPLAAGLLLVTQDINLDPTRSMVLQIDPFTQFSLSPSFGFGVPFFLGALLLIQSRFATHEGPPRESWGLLALVGILVTGMTAAKAFAAVDFVGGLGLYWMWRVWRAGGDPTGRRCS